MRCSLLNKICIFFAVNMPRLWVSVWYLKKFRKFLRWKKPHDLNEKIRWMQFYSDTTIWSQLADKYRVREYISNLGYSHILRDLYGVWRCVDDIDFNILPDRFAIRTNKSCGDTILVNKLENFDAESVRNQLSASLMEKYGVLSVEPHYSRIDPLIIAEQYLEPTRCQESIIDYKFFCFKGTVHSLFTISNRSKDGHTYDQNVFNLNWECMPECLNPKFRNSKIIEKPNHLSEMIQIASDLSRPFPFVRIDLYESNNKVYFGEYTFTPSAGMDNEFSPSYLDELGALIKLEIE